MENKLIINKAFFMKTTCLKVMLNKNKECYIHWGIIRNSKWVWFKVKFEDAELGDIITVLDRKKPSVSFFHDYNGNKRQVWISRQADKVSCKIKEVTRTLSEGEQEVMSVVLKNVIARMAFA